MQAAQLTKYAKDYQLTLNDIATPTIQPNEVLIRTKVAAVNPLDSLIGTGSVRLIQNYQLPQTMGNELTGTIEQIGANVTGFNVGDAIYTRLPLDHIGAFATYVTADYREVAPLPKNLTFTTGAAAALTGLTAYQGLHEELNAQPGQTVFIPGGSGSFGQMAIPIAKDMGLKVIVSGNAEAKERTLAIGADQYFDYRRENYWEKLTDVDFVIDTLGAGEFEHELSIIKAGGRLLSLKAGPNRRFATDRHLPAWKRGLFTLAGAKFDRLAKQHNVEYHFIFVRSDGAQLREVTRIIEKNQIIPAIDPTEFSLATINQAQEFLANGHPKGKVVIPFP
ncbi:NADP-dependent oxidoreductase [Lactiplantibacillus herbarum]|uniref:NADP-dependent oxidoreductase n=1 Tax=Lactiplantibacillus herbarum TaxID=1670446 RepID=UPI0009E37EE7|nr:NADP-dependent oxidoreductase [Lactiplantibacillus herbarum]